MKKLYLIPFLILPTLLLSSCSKKEDKPKTTQSNYISSDSDTILNYSPFNLTDKTLYSNPFVFNETDLIFPNWEDNNKISIIKDPLPTNRISTTSITDFFDYSTESLTLIGDLIYFSNASSNNCLSSINLTTKEYIKINNNNVHNLLSSNDVLFYINKSDKNRIYSYNTLNKQSNSLSSDSVGHFIVSGSYILYQNLSDNSNLYKVNIDGSQNEKLTNYSVDSFVPYENKLLIINSSDNNNLYVLNPIDLSSKRLYIMNGEMLKSIEDKLYFINLKDSNYLYSLQINLEEESVTSSPVIKDGINNYFLTPTSIFFEKRLNVNNVYIQNLN